MMTTQLCPTPAGLMLAGEMIAARDAQGAFDVAGREEEIHALLSAAYERPVPAQAMGYIVRAAHWLEHADEAPQPGEAFTPLAKGLTLLALTGLNDVADAQAAQRALADARDALRKGMSPRALLEKLGLVPDDVELLDKRYNPHQPRVPRGNPDGGQWTDLGASGASSVADVEEVNAGGEAGGAGGAQTPKLSPKQEAIERIKEGIQTKKHGFIEPIKSIPKNGEYINQVNIFIGGFNDSSH